MIFFEKDNKGLTFIEFIFLNTGSIYAKDGVANFLVNHISKRARDKKFFKALDERDIKVHAQTNKEFSTIHFSFLNKYKSFATKKIIEFFNEIDLEKDFEITKEELINKREALKMNNDYIANTNLYRAIFDEPLSIPVIGDKIEEIEVNDLKSHLKNFNKKSCVIVAGGEKLDFEKFIDALNDGEVQKTKKFTPKKNDIIEYKQTDQSYIYFASPFEVEKENRHLMNIAMFVLGSSGFGSRIMEEIRVKRGYAYSAYTFAEIKKSYSIFKGYMQTKLENTLDAIEILKNEIYNFDSITKEELNAAKQFLIGSEPLRNEKLSQRVFRKFMEYYMDLGEGYFEKELKLIENTKLEDVNNFIKNHKIKNLSFSILTDEQNKITLN